MWDELPDCLLNPWTEESVVCDTCGKELFTGDTVYHSVSFNYNCSSDNDFCSKDCAVEYFINNGIEEGVVV